MCNEIVRMEIKAFFNKYMNNDTDFTWENKIYQCRQLLCILPFYTLPLYELPNHKATYLALHMRIMRWIELEAALALRNLRRTK